MNNNDRPNTKINNYMEKDARAKSPASRSKHSEQSGYTETDLDNIDQPTDFSLR